MKIQIARIGDSSTTGGTVLTGKASNTARDKPMATIGDQVSCPKCGNTGVIVEGSSGFTIKGVPVAVDGSLVSCGCPMGEHRIVTIAEAYVPTVTRGFGIVSVASTDAIGTFSGSPSSLANNLVETCSIRIQLSNENNINANQTYKITLRNGQVFNGTTDVNAITEKITTYSAQVIDRIDIIHDIMIGRQRQKMTRRYQATLDNIMTRKGQDIVAVTENDMARPLTTNEISMAKQVFGEHIDYSTVKIHRGNFVTGQPKNTAMAPNGSIYFTDRHYQSDFSGNTSGNKAWFIHEMTHVWQYQSGKFVILHGIWTGLTGGYGRDNSAYNYYSPSNYHKKFEDFGFEQQAAIVEHYFLIHILKNLADPKLVARATFLDNVVGDFFRYHRK